MSGQRMTVAPDPAVSSTNSDAGGAAKAVRRNIARIEQERAKVSGEEFERAFKRMERMLGEIVAAPILADDPDIEPLLAAMAASDSLEDLVARYDRFADHVFRRLAEADGTPNGRDGLRSNSAARRGSRPDRILENVPLAERLGETGGATEGQARRRRQIMKL